MICISRPCKVLWESVILLVFPEALDVGIDSHSISRPRTGQTGSHVKNVMIKVALPQLDGYKMAP